jgi:hypothetical protein
MPVYFIQAVEGGLIKIGVSTNVKHRAKTFGMAARKPMRVLAVMKGDRLTEWGLHKRFAHLLAEGKEWFSPGQDLLDFIAAEGTPSDFVYEPGTWWKALKAKSSHPKHVTIPITSLPEWRTWAERVAKTEGLTLSELVIAAVGEYASARQFNTPPQGRMPFDWQAYRPKGEVVVPD